jgi:hypothetical protein
MLIANGIIPRWQPGLAIVDVTNPAACQWYTDKLSALMDLGVDCFKVSRFLMIYTHGQHLLRPILESVFPTRESSSTMARIP